MLARCYKHFNLKSSQGLLTLMPLMPILSLLHCRAFALPYAALSNDSWTATWASLCCIARA